MCCATKNELLISHDHMLLLYLRHSIAPSPITTMSGIIHYRTLSSDSQGTSKSPRSTSPPSHTFHQSILPHVPTPALLESVAGGAHYSGVNVEAESVLKRRRASASRSHSDLSHDHRRILDDLTELYCGRPTLEILQRSWSKDAQFEVSYCVFFAYGSHFATPGPIVQMQRLR
jgi:hypothetical protein